MASGPITSCQKEGETWEAESNFICLGSKVTADSDCSLEIERCLLLGRKAVTNLDNVSKNRDITLPKCPYRQSYGFSSSHVQMWELDHKESWAPNSWCFRIMVLDKTQESPLDWKKIKSVNPKGNQHWIFIQRTDAKAEAPLLQPPDGNNQLTGQDPGAGKDCRQEKKMGAEDEVVRQHRLLDGHEF